MAAQAHIPVLRDEVLAALAPVDGDILFDGTFGRGGYTSALLATAGCRVLAVDRDPRAVEAGAEMASRFSGRLEVVQARFSDLESLAAARGIAGFDGVTFDLGVSSPQLDDAGRGFSFAKDGPLDMRMGDDGESAADLVNGLEAEALADIIYRYGEEPASRRIARAIVRVRAEAPIETTARLAQIVAQAMGGAGRGGRRIHPATRTFQALRIAVNDELGELRAGLAAAERCLAPAGRLAVVSFHSLEDRIVKRFLAGRSGAAAGGSRHRPAALERPRTFTLQQRRAVKPGERELADNPRARSARLRAAVRTDAPAWPREDAA